MRKSLHQFYRDVISHIMHYLDLDSLLITQYVSKEWKNESDCSPNWRYYCEKLWMNKQNHPLERWVRITPPVRAFDLTLDQVELLALLLLHSKQEPPTVSVLDADHERLQDLTKCVLIVRTMSQKREAAPISHYIRERQIFNEYDTYAHRGELYAHDCASLEIRTKLPFTVSAPLHRFVIRNKGQELREWDLLSWKHSFIASIIDSRRCCITYEVSRCRYPCTLFYNCYRSYVSKEIG